MLIGGPVFARFTHHAALPVAHGYAVLEDDALVAVDGRTIFQRTILLHTNDIPVHRHIDLVPLRHVKVGFVKIDRTLFGRSHPVETPLSVQTFPIRRTFGKYVEGFFFVGEREEPGVGLLLVERHLVGTLPLIALRGCDLVLVGVAREGNLVGQCRSSTRQRHQQQGVD